MPDYNEVNATTAIPAGAGITAGTGTVVNSTIIREGNVATTYLYIDLTGLQSSALGDIIGVNDTTDPCYITQIDDATMGSIFAGTIYCLETPATGDPDIDLYAADEGTGVENGAIGDLTETQLVNAGDHAAGGRDVFTALPTDGQYLYLVSGTLTDAAFTAGKLVIEMKGYVE